MVYLHTLDGSNCYLETYTNTMKHVLRRPSIIMCDSSNRFNLCIFIYCVNKANNLSLHYTVIDEGSN